MVRPEGKTKGIAATERALKVLDVFISSDEPLTLAELTRRSKLVKPTVLRMLVSLSKSGYVVRRADGQYRLGAKVLQLSTAYQTSFKLEDDLLPLLQGLSKSTGETASFFVREGDKRLCLFRVESPHAVRDVVKIGDLKPIDATAMGQVFKKFSVNGDTTRSARGNIFRSAGIGEAHSASIAAPVFELNGKLFGAMSLSGPISRFSDREINRMSKELIEAADYLTTILGGSSTANQSEK